MQEVALPSESELLKLSTEVKKTIASRGQLLIVIDSLKLDKMTLSEKMVYALGLISLGFNESNAIKRLGVRPIEFEAWKNDPKHLQIYDEASSKAEMFLEEKVLSEADENPKMAFDLLKERNRAKEKTEDRKEAKKEDIWEMLQRGKEDRGVEEPKIIDAVLQ